MKKKKPSANAAVESVLFTPATVIAFLCTCPVKSAQAFAKPFQPKFTLSTEAFWLAESNALKKDAKLCRL